MKDNIKLVYSNFDPETGISVVRIKTPSGTFKGKARVHPKDKDFASNIAGCQIAEMRARIKYLKYLANEKRAAAEELRKISNKICQYDKTPIKVKHWCTDAYLKTYGEYKNYKKAIKKHQKLLKEDIENRAKSIQLFTQWTKKNK